ncbi:unnamed protein product, partial [Brassica oleracea]
MDPPPISLNSRHVGNLCGIQVSCFVHCSKHSNRNFLACVHRSSIWMLRPPLFVLFFPSGDAPSLFLISAKSSSYYSPTVYFIVSDYGDEATGSTIHSTVQRKMVDLVIGQLEEEESSSKLPLKLLAWGCYPTKLRPNIYSKAHVIGTIASFHGDSRKWWSEGGDERLMTVWWTGFESSMQWTAMKNLLVMSQLRTRKIKRGSSKSIERGSRVREMEKSKVKMSESDNFQASNSDSIISSSSTEQPVKCACNLTTHPVRVWTRKNPGRRFVSCRGRRVGRQYVKCDIFQWADQEPPHGWQHLALLEARDIINEEKEELAKLRNEVSK